MYIHMYTFIHVPKSGGSCVNHVLTRHPQFKTDDMHRTVCTPTNNPIIIVRDPYDRFISLYQYWKYGSEKYVNRKANERAAFTILDFIEFIKTNNTLKLYGNNTWDVHFKCTTHWIGPPTMYQHIIVLQYHEDMNVKMNELYRVLNITNVKPLPFLNISHKESIPHEDEIRNFVQSYFASDYQLIDIIKRSPSKFKYVI
jgi:hypothetical protein